MEGHVEYMGEKTLAYMILLGKPPVRDHLEDLGLDGMIILKYILKKSFGKVWT